MTFLWEDFTLSAVVAEATKNLGFLTIVQDGGTWLGGFLATNPWGRPLEFRLTSAVQPNRVQQILYAQTLEPYICADLIGKTLLDKTPTPVGLVITDTPAALELRPLVEMPVAWVAHAERAGPDTTTLPTAAEKRPATCPVRDHVHCHARFPDDAPAINGILDQLMGIDLAEPFQRIREAMAEAKRLGIKK